jgi:hypothetical protein
MAANGPHNHPVGYRRDCDLCKAERRAIAAKKRKTPAYRAYRAEQRRNERATRFASVVALPANPANAGTAPVENERENETATREQCARSSKAADQPGTVQQAITLAKILDNPSLASIHPTTSRQLHILLTSLSGGKKKSRGGLAAIHMAYADPDRWKREAQ